MLLLRRSAWMVNSFHTIIEDVGRILILQVDEKPDELGTSINIKTIDRLAIHEVPEKITLTFSKDGHKLLFIDNKVLVFHE